MLCQSLLYSRVTQLGSYYIKNCDKEGNNAKISEEGLIEIITDLKLQSHHLTLYAHSAVLGREH